jgi:hypothetical protein
MDGCTGTRLHGACCPVISSRCMLHVVLVIAALCGAACDVCPGRGHGALEKPSVAVARHAAAWCTMPLPTILRHTVSRCITPHRCMVHDAAAGYTAAYCYSVPEWLSLAHARLCRATAGQGHCCAPSVEGLLCTSKSLPRRPCLLGTPACGLQFVLRFKWFLESTCRSCAIRDEVGRHVWGSRTPGDEPARSSPRASPTGRLQPQAPLGPRVQLPPPQKANPKAARPTSLRAVVRGDLEPDGRLQPPSKAWASC